MLKSPSAKNTHQPIPILSSHRPSAPSWSSTSPKKAPPPPQKKKEPFWFQTNVPRIGKHCLSRKRLRSSVCSAHNHSGQTTGVSCLGSGSSTCPKPPPPRTRSLGGSERPAEPPALRTDPRRCLSRPQPPPARLSIQVLTSLPPQRVPAAGGGPAPPAPALPPPGPRRGARGESGARRHGPDTLPRSARPPAPQEPGARQSAPLPRRPSGATLVARPSPGAEEAGRGPRVARSHQQQGAPPTSPGRPGARRDRYPSDVGAPATHRLAPRLPPRRRRSFLPAAAALSQPQAPRSSPIYKLAARSWELEMRLSLPSASLSLRPLPRSPLHPAQVAAAATTSARAARLPSAALLLPPPPPGRAPSRPRACAGGRGARARARGGAAASGKPGPASPAEAPRPGGAPSERPQTAPGPDAPPVLRGLSMVSPVLAPSRACERVTRPNPHRPFRAEIAAVIQHLQTSKILPRAWKRLPRPFPRVYIQRTHQPWGTKDK